MITLSEQSHADFLYLNVGQAPKAKATLALVNYNYGNKNFGTLNRFCHILF